jgi:hypothetical protein
MPRLSGMTAFENITHWETERMSDHKKSGHHRDQHANPSDGEHRPGWKQAHKDWRLWIVVGLMLLAMLTYVMTMDERFQPGGKMQDAVPAAPGL